MTPSVPTPAQSGIDRLLEVVNRLRGEDGCPWDREQTASSLLTYMIEELYELSSADIIIIDTSWLMPSRTGIRKAYAKNSATC